MKRLLDAGADVNACNAAQETALTVAAGGIAPDVVQLLLDSKARAGYRNRVGETPLMVAVKNTTRTQYVRFIESDGRDRLEDARLSVFKILLDSAGYLDDQDEDGNTPLIVAASRGNTIVTRALLNHGAGRYLDSRNRAGLTALDMARERQHHCVVELLEAAHP